MISVHLADHRYHSVEKLVLNVGERPLRLERNEPGKADQIRVGKLLCVVLAPAYLVG